MVQYFFQAYHQKNRHEILFQHIQSFAFTHLELTANIGMQNQMDSPASKRQCTYTLKYGQADPDPKECPPPMKITNLIDDCLVKIFEFLDLRNLFNVALSSEWLRPAAREEYQHRFGTQKVHMNIDDMFYGLTCGPYVYGDEIKVHGFKMCLQFLRCFGPSIRNLGVWYKRWSDKQCQHIDEYVNKYCADALIAVEFVGKPCISTVHFEKPFVNVEKLEILNCDLSDQLPSFPQWFPNVRTLALCDVCMDKRFIERAFHHLQDLRIDINKNDARCFQDEDVAKLVQMCSHQLHSLNIRVHGDEGLTFNALLDLIEIHATLRNLYIDMFACTTVQEASVSQVQRLIQKHPELVILDIPNYKITVENAIALIQQLDSLKRFRFQLKNRRQYNGLVACLVGSPWLQPSVQRIKFNFLIVELLR